VEPRLDSVALSGGDPRIVRRSLLLGGALVAWLLVGAPVLLAAPPASPLLAAELLLIAAIVWVAIAVDRIGLEPRALRMLPGRLAGAGLGVPVTIAAALGVLALAMIGVEAASAGASAGFAERLLHWGVAGAVAPLVAAAAWLIRRERGSADLAAALASGGAALYLVEIITGLATAAGVSPGDAHWVAAVHLWIGAASWACLAGAVAAALLPANTAATGAAGVIAAPAADVAPWRTKVRAYVALTKPRIIELLLVTTLPAMLLAARDVPGLSPWYLSWLVAWTLIGGTLAAGAANAMNCYLDRDIDLVMTRTRRRPLPAHTIAPEDALTFGLALGVGSFVLLVVFVNLLAAVLTMLAIAFYVIVYTLLLKRSTTQNIVIGGAAGALPPMIGWAAVTGEVSAASILLFLIVFYWTPPHFWALSMRLLRDYAAARVPMLPVVRGVPVTNRKIVLYTALLVALTLALVPIGAMGLIYVVGAVAFGAWFLAETLAMWRDASPARAIRVYKISITYLTGLFAAIALDALLTIRL
jgi:protoheme IX farnesyltransferase